jgi:putative DNA primase/helicase
MAEEVGGAVPIWKKEIFVDPYTTHVELARRLAGRYQAKMRFVHGVGWFIWDKTHWSFDITKRVQGLAKGLVDSLVDQAKRASREEARGLVGVIRAVGKASGIRSVLELAESEDGFSTEVTDLDMSPEFLACANGTINLETGEFLDAHWNPEHMLTRCCPADYVEGATDERFGSILDHLIPDEAGRLWLQKAVGYSVLGNPREDKIFYLVGPTAAGKGTFLAALHAALGEYFTNARMESFCVQQGNDPSKARSDLHRLIQTRMVVADEIRRGFKFDAGVLKNIAGGGWLLCRTLRQPEVLAPVTFVLWVVANPGDLPKLPADDDAIWRRVVQFHIGGSIPKDERDPNFRDKVVKETSFRSAVLAWVVQGATRYLLEGLGDPPESVSEATQKLRDDMNTFGPLLELLKFGKSYITSKDTVRALAEDALGWKPTPKALKGALDRAAALEGVDLTRSSVKVQALAPDGGTKTLAAWRGVGIADLPTGDAGH